MQILHLINFISTFVESCTKRLIHYTKVKLKANAKGLMLKTPGNMMASYFGVPGIALCGNCGYYFVSVRKLINFSYDAY